MIIIRSFKSSDQCDQMIGLAFDTIKKTLHVCSEVFAKHGVCTQKYLMPTDDIAYAIASRDELVEKSKKGIKCIGVQSTYQYDPADPKITFTIYPKDQRAFRELFDELPLEEHIENYNEELNRVRALFKKNK